MFKKGDKVKDKNGKCWTILKIHTDDQSPYNIDFKEACVSDKMSNLTKITEEEYSKFYNNSNIGKYMSCDTFDHSHNNLNKFVEKTSLQEQSDIEHNDVNKPSHYRQGKIEVIEFIEDQNFDFRLANAIKYICRARYKGKEKQDLEKALWYINRYIQKDLSWKN
jgi:hypothetical protein